MPIELDVVPIIKPEKLAELVRAGVVAEMRRLIEHLTETAAPGIPADQWFLDGLDWYMEDTQR